jgi:pimeloyl-ACP methyl ester carboxylesterase
MNEYLAIEGHRLHYCIEGNGPVIVLLHGFLESLEIWDEFASVLSKEFSIVRIDFPGHGKSDNFSDVHTMEFMASCVKAVLDHRNICNCLLVGHSMGGYVSLAFAENYPQFAKGIILFHSQAAPDSAEALENRVRTINIVKKNRSGFIRQFIPDLFDLRNISKFSGQIKDLVHIASEVNDIGIIAALQGMKERYGWTELLSVSDLPFLFIIGKQDSRILPKLVMDQALIPKHSEVLLLENVGHMGFIEAPHKTLQTLRYFALKCF